jgi:2-methylcitrate dehydratase PrpD
MPSSSPVPDVALAARDGLAAALLAQHDSGDRMRPIDPGQDALATLGIAHNDALLQGLGAQWQWARMAYKAYPCDSALHAAIEAALAVRARHRTLARHIAHVEVRAHPIVCAHADMPAPQDPRQARRSLQHAVAAALIDGTAGLEQFGERRIAAVRVAEMRARIALRGDASVPAGAAHIALRLADGRVLEHGVRCARGHPARPLGDAELSDKFRELASGVLATDQAERLLALAWNVRSLADIGALLRASVPDDALDPIELPGSPLIPR